MTGCFQFFPTLVILDRSGTTDSTIVKLHEFIHFYDSLMAHTYGTESSGSLNLQSETMAYIPYSLVSFYRFCAQTSKLDRLTYPRDASAHFQLKQELATISQTFLENASVESRRWLTPKTLTTQLAPYLSHILCPPVKSVRPSLVLSLFI